MSARRLTLDVLDGTLAVCKLPADGAPPAWAFSGAVSVVARTPGELTIVCASASVPTGTQAETGWRALRIVGPFDFALTGILASVAQPLAAAGVSIFAVSTYDTDYVLVKERQLEAAIAALREAGHEVRDAA